MALYITATSFPVPDTNTVKLLVPNALRLMHPAKSSGFGGKLLFWRQVSVAPRRRLVSFFSGRITVRHAGHDGGDCQCCLGGETAVTFAATLEGPARARSGTLAAARRGSRADSEAPARRAEPEQRHSEPAATGSHGTGRGTHSLRLANPSQPRTLATAKPRREGGTRSVLSGFQVQVGVTVRVPTAGGRLTVSWSHSESL